MAERIDYRMGADPELFVCKAERPRTIIPVCGLVGGTKQEPIPVELGKVLRSCKSDLLKGNFAYQEDTVAYEFNVPSANCEAGFAYSVQDMLNYTKNTLLKEKGLVYKVKPYHQFSVAALKRAGDQAMVFGCDPDFYAYGEESEGYKREPPKAGDLGGLRFCGGHIHFGYPPDAIPPNILAQFIDLFIHLPCLFVDKQGKRRGIYGLPGLYRVKPYGLEYRSLSSFWVNKTDLSYRIAQIGFALMKDAVECPELLAPLYGQIPWNDVQQAIITEDGDLGMEILKHVGGLKGAMELRAPDYANTFLSYMFVNRVNLRKET